MQRQSRKAVSPARHGWRQSAQRAELLSLYAEADALVAGWMCSCSGLSAPGTSTNARCCHFALTGREPYPTAVELAEMRHALRATGTELGRRRRLPVTRREDGGACPLLSDTGRCRIYASRPLGCRTFFCAGAEAPFGERLIPLRDQANAIGRRIADLSERFAPEDPHPRALTKSLGISR